LLGLGAGVLAGCSEDRAEQAGQSVGNVSTKVGQTVEGLAARTGRAVVIANDRAGRFFERAGEKIQGKPAATAPPATP
jgi:hypothetical protein